MAKATFFILQVLLSLCLTCHCQVTPTVTGTKIILALVRVKAYSTVPTELWTGWRYTQKLKICNTRP